MKLFLSYISLIVTSRYPLMVYRFDKFLSYISLIVTSDITIEVIEIDFYPILV